MNLRAGAHYGTIFSWGILGMHALESCEREGTPPCRLQKLSATELVVPLRSVVGELAMKEILKLARVAAALFQAPPVLFAVGRCQTCADICQIRAIVVLAVTCVTIRKRLDVIFLH